MAETPCPLPSPIILIKLFIISLLVLLFDPSTIAHKRVRTQNVPKN